MAADFTTDLKRGDIGQSLYYAAHLGLIVPKEGKESDFVDVATGQGIEIKTDYYGMKQTPNFFFERYSNLSKMSPGGPWQALTHHSTKFVYFYIRDMVWFEFDTTKLVDMLDDIIPTLPPTDVKNNLYITRGFRVPRHFLKDIYRTFTIEVTAKEILTDVPK